MIGGKRIVVVIPAYQEEALLPVTLAGVPSNVDRIIVVDDGSTDLTLACALRAAQGDPRIVAINQSNQGVGAAIVTGYRAALRAAADVVVVMAGDNQMDPGDFDEVVAPVVSGAADYVKGDRLVHLERKRMPSHRRFGTQLLAVMTSVVSGVRVHDSQCGYTAISAYALRQLPLERLYPRYGYPNDMLMRLAERGLRVCEVPVRPVYGAEVSGLKVHRVVLPIGQILLRGAVRRSILRLVS